MPEVWQRAAALAFAEAERLLTKGLGALRQGARLVPPFFPMGWVPPPTDPSDPSTSAQTVRARTDTVIHYVVGIHYEHETGESVDCDWCKGPLDSQTSVVYASDQTCDWEPPKALADGPIGRTPEEALAETADT